MRIVFLDFDGVVSCLDETGFADQPFGRRAAANINALCARFDAELVLTSSWRWSARLNRAKGRVSPPTHDEVIEFLAANGITAPLFPRIDAEDDLSWAVPEMWRGDEEEREIALRIRAKYAAPALPDGVPPCRGDEVRAWLDCVMPDAVPTDWLLLDDENDYWPSQIDRLVLCDPLRGFDEEALSRAITLISC